MSCLLKSKVVWKPARFLIASFFSLQTTVRATSNKANVVPNKRNKNNIPKEALFDDENMRILPDNVLAAYVAPVRHPVTKDAVECAQIMFKSYELSKLEFFADFAVRCAYYMNIPVRGPTPLPKKIQRWTLVRSPFVHKASQENFERITYSRLLRLFNVNSETLEVLLGYLNTSIVPTISMDVTVYEHEKLDVLDRVQQLIPDANEETWECGREDQIIPKAVDRLLSTDKDFVALMKKTGR
ncbi:mitochondrial 37S ribosomal protein RSM10 [Schizosaccharomyces japonicus yFS275]|uniref:Small ribosomal subunit protein uS10m n=1 Tax=Schizosaccharomyces japonicus (strain yFS275 / FY16936) TaxID=402676 RepID=B6JWT5_SCHJY|nr:mitochondrial 37S ribosomal protein RSM10 [Schizosaccharomyces japonicus yFS275]EEB05836.1 ribosomal protein subunit S10 [Schizosaccharomyces japonicus yFS275]